MSTCLFFCDIIFFLPAVNTRVRMRKGVAVVRVGDLSLAPQPASPSPPTRRRPPSRMAMLARLTRALRGPGRAVRARAYSTGLQVSAPNFYRAGRLSCAPPAPQRFSGWRHLESKRVHFYGGAQKPELPLLSRAAQHIQ